MNYTNKHEEMIRYGDPLIAGIRRRRKGYPIISYKDRSPEVTAMNAHLRAAAYPERDDKKSGTMRSLIKINPRSKWPGWFRKFGRLFEIKAGSNFIIGLSRS
jgi:hypothetical protein